jgi:hypothetical protein
LKLRNILSFLYRDGQRPTPPAIICSCNCNGSRSLCTGLERSLGPIRASFAIKDNLQCFGLAIWLETCYTRDGLSHNHASREIRAGPARDISNRIYLKLFIVFIMSVNNLLFLQVCLKACSYVACLRQVLASSSNISARYPIQFLSKYPILYYVGLMQFFPTLHGSTISKTNKI